MLRRVTQPTSIGSRKLNPGDRVFLAYTSGSRDEGVFECPGQLQLKRRFAKQHLGFGRGIHACLGAPLARLLLKTEMLVLRERLPNLRLITPYEQIQYEKVGASRGVANVVVAWDPPPMVPLSKWMGYTLNAGVAEKRNPNVAIPAVVKQLSLITDEVLEVTIAAKHSPLTSLPSWEPGARIDILSPDGYRQYSICSDPRDTNTWKVAMRKECQGSGGSIWFHGNLKEGAEITMRGPRNHFRLQKGDRYVFIAGGNGITPMIPMLDEAKRQRASYKLVYLGRSRRTMAYCEELARGEHPVEIWAADEHRNQKFDIVALVAQQKEPTQVYCCGPERLLGALEDACRLNPKIQLRVERFQVASNVTFPPTRPFDVVLNGSGRKLTVGLEDTLLEVLNRNGCGIMSTCRRRRD